MKPRKFIQVLADLYAERRSDVHEICLEYLETGEFNPDWAEHRHINAKIKDYNIKLYYDTLTTTIDYSIDDGKTWNPAENHEYFND